MGHYPNERSEKEYITADNIATMVVKRKERLLGRYFDFEIIS